MTSVVLIDKLGQKKKTVIKKFDLETLYKKCNFRNNTNFKKRWTWKIKENVYISLFSKDTGRSNNINKFDLPPPIDKTIYYGSMIIVKHNHKMVKNENIENITLDEWEKFYEKLFGGFEDLGEEDSFSEDEKIPDHLKTKQGYSKEGGFIVSDSDEDDEDYLPENSDELEELSEYDSNDNIDGDDDEEEEEEHYSGDDDDEDEEEDFEEEDDYDEEDDYEDDMGSELSEEDYVEEA